ncbi:uncharacterized protein LOC127258074 [Andrographis paniculata]|uniref:uncharacterized protein LOC127258074 n=1 Tax=Andrographis paniculata TaxID=175694 RepID=UPI0021E8412B|nr:uncharacterized protein LOC127258074 [Andrographis paniculata]
MGVKRGISLPIADRTRRRRSTSSILSGTIYGKPRVSRRRWIGQVDNNGSDSVSGKLLALRSLVPSRSEEINPDRLFEETADYIVRLETKVFVLQKLIELHGSQSEEIKQDAV